MKKINIKHGLDWRGEITARRIREKLESDDETVISEYNKLWKEFIKLPMGTKNFKDFLKERNLVYYSAFERACKAQTEQKILNKIVF